jgi:hypothetical protein
MLRVVSSENSEPRRVIRSSDKNALAVIWMQLAITLWVAIALAHAVKTLSDPLTHSVYPIFHEAGRAWWEGRSIYHDLDGGKNEFFYSPAFAVALTPLSFLPLPIAAVTWSWLSLGLMFGSLRALYKETVGKWWPSFVEGQFLLLCGTTAIQGGWSAQSNSLVLAGVLFGATSLLRGHYWRAAFCLAAPIHIKVWPLVAAALLGIRYFKQLSWRVMIAVAVVGALPLVTASPTRVWQAYETWQTKLAQREDSGPRYGGYRDAYTILENSVGAPNKLTYKAMQVAGGLLVLGWCIRNARTGFTPQRWLISTMAWWSIWQLLFGPGSERLTYGILAPAVAYAVLESATLKRGQWMAWSAWLMTGILGTGEVENAILKVWAGAETMTPLGVVILAFWLFRHECSAASEATQLKLHSEPNEPPAAYTPRLDKIAA